MAIAECVEHGFAEHDANVFGRVVTVDLDVALGDHGQVDRTVARDLIQHVREEG